ncbi:MAG: glycine zipper 2TM domain-containing protein [Sedimenticolaceae bacterium]
MNLSRSLNSLFALVLVISIAGCAGGPGPSQMGMQTTVYGVVEQIDPTTISDDNHPGVGAIIGAAGGGLLGSLIGAGTGRDVAIAVGAIGGAIAGHEVQKRHDTEPGSHITVRLDSGVLVVVTQPVNPDLKVGDKVMVQGQGEDARVTRI